MTVAVIVNTDGDVYMLVINTKGSKEGTEQNREILAISSLQRECFLRCLPVFFNTPLLFIRHIIDIGSDPIADSIEVGPGRFVGRITEDALQTIPDQRAIGRDVCLHLSLRHVERSASRALVG